MKAYERAWRGARNDWRLYLLSIFSVAVAFTCLAASLLVVSNVDAVRREWAERGRLSVYLKSGANDDQIARLEKALQATPGVATVTRVTSEQARHELGQNSPDDVIRALPDEAFPASLEIGLEPGALAELDKIGAQLALLPAVESVETYQAWKERLAHLIEGGVTATSLLAFVIFASVISVVSATIRLALQRRSIEVEVLRLVGATNGYVRGPFLVEGAAQGAIGSVLALMLLGVLFGIVRSHFSSEFSSLLGLAPAFLPWWSMVALVAIGCILGVLAAHMSLRRLLLL
jgi:cell division transport system permease protein